MNKIQAFFSPTFTPNSPSNQGFSDSNLSEQYKKLLAICILFLTLWSVGCESKSDFISKSKKELGKFEKWCWGKSFDRNLKYDLSGMTWQTEVSVTPDGQCRKVIRRNDNPKQANLTIGEFCNSREGWLLSTSDKKFAGLSTYRLTFAKDGMQSAGLSEFSGDVFMGILGGKSILTFLEESSIEKVYQKFGGTEKLEGLSCDHPKYPTTAFYFDKNHRLKYIEVDVLHGDTLLEKRFGEDEIYNDSAGEKFTYGPIEYGAFQSRSFPQSYRVIQKKKSIEQGISVSISNVSACQDRYEKEIPFPEALLVSGKQVQSNADDGQIFSIKNNRLVQINSDGSPIVLNKSRPSSSLLNSYYFWVPASSLFCIGFILLIRSRRQPTDHLSKSDEETEESI